MPIRKHRRKRNKRRRHEAKAISPKGFVAFKHPLSTLPREQVIKGLIEVGKASKSKFPEKLTEAEEITRLVDPLQTISTLSVYGLFGGIDDKGNISKGYLGERFNQSHVELVQSLFLRIPLDKQSQSPATPETVQKLFELLPELTESFKLQRFVELEKQLSQDEKAIRLVQEELRLHTQVVRNWGYLTRVIGITKRLCEPSNRLFEQKLGLSATQLIDLFYHLIRRNEKLVNARLDKLRPVFSESTVLGMISAYYKANPHFLDSKDDFIRFATENELTQDQIKSLFLSHSDLSLSDVFTFTPEDLAAETVLSPTSIAKALEQLCMRFGDTAANNLEHIFLDNPVWTKPVIALGDGRYFCALPQVFFSFVFQILGEIIKGDTEAEKEWADRRSVFLETEISKLFSTAFTGCEIASGYRWRDGTTEYENDLLVKIDSHLILVEAKSHSISWPALRGATKRAKKHVEEVLLEPSTQSLRLANRVLEARDVSNGQESLLPNFPFALDEIRTILRLSVTLEDFATLQTTLHHVKEAGWIPEDHPVAPCMLLADLEIVFDILESTPHKIHYLKRRADLEANLSYKGDELDLLGFYLETGFNIGQAEFSEDHFVLTTSSKKIDAYYSALDEGFQRKKPAPKMTKWWWDICRRIETRDFHQWSDIAIILLSFPFSEQDELATKFKRITKNVMKNWRIKNHLCSVILTPPEGKMDALAVYAFREREKINRHDRMENIASQVFASSHVTRCLVIAANIDKQHYPYTTLAVYFSPKIA